MTSLETLLKEGTKVLEQHKIQEARLDAWLLLEYVTGMNRAFYFAHSADGMDEEKADRYRELIRKRAAHVPLQHITHQAYFMGFEFYVNQNVLVPRQDTETLVECVLSYVQPQMKVLDMCTGSGCILISLMKLGKIAQAVGADISDEALKTAKKNAEKHQVEPLLIKSDLFENVADKYDVIVSNPPYIRTAVIEELKEEVRCHDPILALDGKEDGLYFYRKLIEQSPMYLKKGGMLYFEIGHDQGQDVKCLMEKAGFEDVMVKKDLAGLDRVVFGVYNIAEGEHIEKGI